jgi:hypothetical protein
MAGGKIRHWKHGWIPVSPEAKAFVAGRGPRPVTDQAIKSTTNKATPFLLESIRENGGFTYNPRTGGLLEVGKSKGFAVAVPGTETVVGREKVKGEDVTREDFAKGVASVIMAHRDRLATGKSVLGGWYSPERNEYMVEVTDILPADNRGGAIREGQRRNQEAIFDLATGETINTGGTGDAARPDVEPDPETLNTLTTPMSPEQQAAAKYYTGPGYAPLNLALRKDRTMPSEVDFRRKHLDRLLANSVTTKDATVYRGIQSYPGFPSYMAPGTVYSDKGYMSTAVAPEPPEDYQGDTMFQIRVPKGTNALDLNAYALSHHPNERELLLPHGTQLRVVADRAVNGKRMIEFEVLQ